MKSRLNLPDKNFIYLLLAVFVSALSIYSLPSYLTREFTSFNILQKQLHTFLQAFNFSKDNLPQDKLVQISGFNQLAADSGLSDFNSEYLKINLWHLFFVTLSLLICFIIIIVSRKFVIDRTVFNFKNGRTEKAELSVWKRAFLTAPLLLSITAVPLWVINLRDFSSAMSAGGVLQSSSITLYDLLHIRFTEINAYVLSLGFRPLLLIDIFTNILFAWGMLLILKSLFFPLLLKVQSRSGAILFLSFLEVFLISGLNILMPFLLIVVIYLNSLYLAENKLWQVLLPQFLFASFLPRILSLLISLAYLPSIIYSSLAVLYFVSLIYTWKNVFQKERNFQEVRSKIFGNRVSKY